TRDAAGVRATGRDAREPERAGDQFGRGAGALQSVPQLPQRILSPAPGLATGRDSARSAISSRQRGKRQLWRKALRRERARLVRGVRGPGRVELGARVAKAGGVRAGTELSLVVQPPAVGASLRDECAAIVEPRIHGGRAAGDVREKHSG